MARWGRETPGIAVALTVADVIFRYLPSRARLSKGGAFGIDEQPFNRE